MNQNKDELKDLIKAFIFIIIPTSLLLGIDYLWPDIKKWYTQQTENVSKPITVDQIIDSEQEIVVNSTVQNSDEETYELPEPIKKYKQCPLCYGSRVCGACGGSGQVYNSIGYSQGQYITCSSCGGNQLCPICEGTGAVEDFGW